MKPTDGALMLPTAAMEWAPAGAAGTVNVHPKFPLGSVVSAQRTVVESQVREYGEVPPKPIPVTLSEEPTNPDVSEIWRNGATVKPAVAEFRFSTAEMLCTPPGAAGTLKAHERAPSDRVDPVQRVTVKFQVTLYAASASNPSPVAVTEVPTVPLLSESRRDGSMVIWAEALVPAVPTTVCGPSGDAGRAIEQPNAPSALVVDAQRVALAFHLTVNAVVPANPAPVISTAAPTYP